MPLVMPSIKNKAYDLLLKSLDELTRGVIKHCSNPRIASSLDVAELVALKTDLELLREDYVRHETEARKAYEQFHVKFKSVQKKVSNDCRILKGILDPSAEELLDFGIFPERSKNPKKKVLVD